MEGIIIKALSGFYYVKCEEEVYQCKARGIFKKKKLSPLVGDRVIVSLHETADGDDGVIEEIFPRKNAFIRPPVSNIDCFIIVAALTSPKPNYAVIDKFLVMAEKHSADVIICANKIDIAGEDDRKKIKEIYEGVYPLVFVSGETGEGIEELRSRISNCSYAFAGPSGAGKSTIINALIPSAESLTGEISTKTGRGRHTTRHVELFPFENGGMLCDTPGFTSFDMAGIEEEELPHLYPEFERLRSECKFDNCRHLKEPGCKVREAVKQNEISCSRYDSYVMQIEEIRKARKY